MKWGDRAAAALEALRKYGPMTRAKLQQRIGVEDKRLLGQLVTRMTTISKKGPFKGQRRAHIIRWTRVQAGARDYLRPVYAYGHGENAPRPAPRSKKAVNAKYRANVKAQQAEVAQRYAFGSHLQAAWAGREAAP